MIKRYRSWDRGEPQVEWRALTLLAEYAPGLAASPLRFAADSGSPMVVMSRLNGVPLRGGVVDSLKVVEVARAVHELHTAVPEHVLNSLPPSSWNPAVAVSKARRWRAEEVGSDDRWGRTVARAFGVGTGWVEEHRLDAVVEADVEPVFGMADGNLANYLWDGSRVRLVDFEDSGRSDRCFEIAELVEHPSVWVDSRTDVPALLACMRLSHAEEKRFLVLRRVLAFLWLIMMLPGREGHRRNPPGALESQARHVLSLA
ncbi:phosphotransferase (plasmid) [Nocardiopsis eucommiae]|uniref:Phosphotransferase n=1 Tax=Nocardiopsis eucommiae TaxID=2831970 RepID=A0A975LD86_9ACTN|nr:phosphotransferase [Nocardiopsis eucommiae]